MASVVAERLIGRLERDGFVIMRRPPAPGAGALGRGPGRQMPPGVLREVRQPAEPRPAKPSSIIAQVEGSGAADAPLTDTSSTNHSAGFVLAAIDMVSDPVPTNVKVPSVQVATVSSKVSLCLC
jgi:hypothetical protein